MPLFLGKSLESLFKLLIDLLFSDLLNGFPEIIEIKLKLIKIVFNETII